MSSSTPYSPLRCSTPSWAGRCPRASRMTKRYTVLVDAGARHVPHEDRLAVRRCRTLAFLRPNPEIGSQKIHDVREATCLCSVRCDSAGLAGSSPRQPQHRSSRCAATAPGGRSGCHGQRWAAASAPAVALACQGGYESPGDCRTCGDRSRRSPKRLWAERDTTSIVRTWVVLQICTFPLCVPCC
jgi:hypothetical protein